MSSSSPEVTGTAPVTVVPRQHHWTRGYLSDLRGMGRDWFDGWKLAFSKEGLSQDVIAGLTVAAVAMPLNLALAVASGLPPAAGLIAGAFGGALAALFGGSVSQVTGPAAALSTLVLAIVARFGVAGAVAAALMIGVAQLVLGLARAGGLVRFVPESVLIGFTTGVGIKLLDNQIPELLGFDYRVVELVQMIHRPEWLHEVRWLAVLGGLAVAFLVVTMRTSPRFPAALIGVAAVTAISAYLGWDLKRVGELPSPLTVPALPDLNGQSIWALVTAVIPLALLASAESLLSARATDRLSNATRPHNPNLELLGQGIANLGAGLMGGMPVSGVIVRSSVNVQSGGRTRRSALFHAVALFFALLWFAPSMSKIPLAALAGLLCVVGTRLIELKSLAELWKGRRIEAVAFVVTAAGTATGHLMTGLVAGIVLAVLGNRLAERQAKARRSQELRRKAGIRAVVEERVGPIERELPSEDSPAETLPPVRKWLANILAPGQRAASAFVHAQASVVGQVLLGEHVHIAAGCSVRADEGAPFYIGANSNLQDGVVLHALLEGKVVVGREQWAVYIGRSVSVAHQALIHGPCYVGDRSFIGFKAVVHDSVVGANCYIGIGAVVVGVEIPEGRFVPNGMVVDTPEKVKALGPVTGIHVRFSETVAHVNSGLAEAYRQVSGDREGG